VGGCGGPWNNPYPARERGQNILYSAFVERPKHFDPVQSYAENEYVFIAQIYMPPLQYHYFKRPYELIPFSATEVPRAQLFDAGGRLILRLVRGPDDAQLEELNREFADIVVEGRIERAVPAPPEISDADALDTDRIAFVFDRRQFGRLRQMIDHLNDLVVTPETFELPEPMTEEQAERPW